MDDTKQRLREAADVAMKTATEAVTKRWRAEMLKDADKNLLAALMTEIESALPPTDKLSEAALERRARATEKYREFKRGQWQARKEQLVADTRAETARLNFECEQSRASYEREEMRQSIAAN